MFGHIIRNVVAACGAVVLIAGSLALSATSPSIAGLTVASPSVPLSAEEKQIVEENPALRQLSLLSPKLLRQALDIIVRAKSGGDPSRGGLAPLDQNDLQLLDQNPVLREVWQSSPEASADLLQLLKTAGGTRPPRK